MYDPVATPAVSPAVFAPERTVVTTGLTKNLAIGGWRTGVARLPAGETGQRLRERLVGVASQIWSSPAAPVQAAAAYAFAEPDEIVEHIAASRRLHETVTRAMAERFAAAGAVLEPVVATCYLYPDFEPLRAHLAEAHGVRTGADLAALLVERYGVGLLPASAFGETGGVAATAGGHQPPVRRHRGALPGGPARRGPARARLDPRLPRPGRGGPRGPHGGRRRAQPRLTPLPASGCRPPSRRPEPFPGGPAAAPA